MLIVALKNIYTIYLVWLLDKYIDLVSKDTKFSELTADIDFVKDAENAIALSDKKYGVPEVSKESQLTPWGDAEMFEDNVPVEKMVVWLTSVKLSQSTKTNSPPKRVEIFCFSFTISFPSGICLAWINSTTPL